MTCIQAIFGHNPKFRCMTVDVVVGNCFNPFLVPYQIISMIVYSEASSMGVTPKASVHRVAFLLGKVLQSALNVAISAIL